MIVDRLERRHIYADNKALFNTLCCIASKKTKLSLLAQHSNIQISDIALISKPIEEYVFEAHKKYIDIHYIVEGVEGIAIADTNILTEEVPYDEVKDIAFYTPQNELSITPIYLMPGMFLICWPHEAHCTSIMQNTPGIIKKFVAKVEV